MVSQVAELKSISINAKPKTPDPAHLYLGAYNVYYVKFNIIITICNCHQSLPTIIMASPIFPAVFKLPMEYQKTDLIGSLAFLSCPI
ncbi:Uncharacterised protein [Yersinia frederiksenii]|nr:Uncharacterised protein [Yersinia frederiksenii]CNI28715.1 Uncharacterised protein [Yersinia frederiksenii]